MKIFISLIICGLTMLGVQNLACFPQMESLDYCFENEFSKLDEHQFSYSVILGNSRSLSAVHGPTLSRHYSETFLHLGYSSSDMLTAHLTLAYALKRNPAIKRVLIEVSPFHFDSRRVSSHKIRHYFFQREPSLLIDHGRAPADFSNLFPKSSTFTQLKSVIQGRNEKSDYSKRWECAPQFQRNESNWKKVFEKKELQFETEQVNALKSIQSICCRRQIPLTVIFAPTDTVFQQYFDNYEKYKAMVKRSVREETVILDFDKALHTKYLMDPDHVGCPEKFTSEAVLPNL